MKRSPGYFNWNEAKDIASSDPDSPKVIGAAICFDLQDGYAFPLFMLDGTPVRTCLNRYVTPSRLPVIIDAGEYRPLSLDQVSRNPFY